LAQNSEGRFGTRRSRRRPASRENCCDDEEQPCRHGSDHQGGSETAAGRKEEMPEDHGSRGELPRRHRPGHEDTRRPGQRQIMIRRSLAGAVVALSWTAAAARAQAFLPATGEGTVSLLYQEAFARYHDIPGEGKVYTGHIKTQSLLLDFTYGLSRKLALGVSIPWIASKYNGPRPHVMDDGIPEQYQVPFTPIDSGAYHPTFQDYRFE